MKNLNSYLFLVLCLILVSCSPKDTNEATPTPNAPPTNNLQQGGTDSNGGGNGLNGKLLESYIDRNLKSRVYYVTYLKPLIETLAAEYPYLAADMIHIASERDWYFVPAELEQISKNILGTYAGTDQYALQDLNKIWVNSILFDKMESDLDRATLVLHEMIMGIRLMQYKNTQDLCIAKAARVFVAKSDKSIEELEKYYIQKKSECRITYPIIPGLEKQKFKLHDEDYDLIRKIVSMLVAEKLEVKEIKSIIEAHKFRIYED